MDKKNTDNNDDIEMMNYSGSSSPDLESLLSVSLSEDSSSSDDEMPYIVKRKPKDMSEEAIHKRKYFVEPPRNTRLIPQKRLRTRRRKDPNKPKAPTSAFLFFTAAMFKKVRVSLPLEGEKNITIRTVCKIGEIWKSMTEEEKKPYVDASIEDWTRYYEEMEYYVPPVYEKKKKEDDFEIPVGTGTGIDVNIIDDNDINECINIYNATLEDDNDNNGYSNAELPEHINEFKEGYKDYSNPFSLYVARKFNKVKKLLESEGKDAGCNAVLERLVEMWKLLPYAQRLLYIRLRKKGWIHRKKEIEKYLSLRGNDDSEGESGSDSDSDKKAKHKKRTRKDPNAPKRPKKPFAFYMDEVFKDVKRTLSREVKYYGIKVAKARIAEMWDEMTDEQKKPYVEAAEKDMLRYKEEKAKYLGDSESVSKRDRDKIINFKKKKAKKDPNAPKAPKKPFILYIAEVFEDVKKTLASEGKKHSPKVVMAKIGEMWRGLTDEQKKPYFEAAKKDSLRYREEMLKYVPPEDVRDSESESENESESESGSDSENDEKVNPKKKKAKKDPNAPKRPKTPSALYVAEMLGYVNKTLISEGKDHSPKVVMTKVAEMWRGLTDEQKKPYVEAAEKDSLRYKEEMSKCVPPEVASERERDKIIKLKKKKAKKDPNAPKAPKKPFMLYIAEVFEDVKKTLVSEGKDTNAGAVTTRIGEMWRGLTDEQKKPYFEAAKKDSLRYREEMLKYVPPEDVSDSESESGSDSENVEKVNPKKKKAKKGPNVPKRPKTPAALYVSEVFKSVKETLISEGKDHSPKVVMKRISEMWRSMTDEQKKPYVEAAEKDLLRYKKEKAKYVDKSDSDSDSDSESGSDSESESESESGSDNENDEKVNPKKKKAKKDSNAPKRPKAPFIFFVSEVLSEVKESLISEGKDHSPKVVMKRISEMWRSMTDEQKKPYVEAAEKDLLRYKKEKAKYVLSK